MFEKIKKKLPIYKLSEQSAQAETVSLQNNLNTIAKIIDDYEQNENYISINNLIDYFDQIKDDRNFELPSANTQELNAVQILTIHASKGLEYPYVFVLSIANSSQNIDKTSIIFDMQYGNKHGFGIISANYKGNSTANSLVYIQ